jgi:hypothetical protein
VVLKKSHREVASSVGILTSQQVAEQHAARSRMSQRPPEAAAAGSGGAEVGSPRAFKRGSLSGKFRGSQSAGGSGPTGGDLVGWSIDIAELGEEAANRLALAIA